MVETAASALDELTKLLQINEPLWSKSSTDGRYYLLRDSYEKILPRPNHFRSSSVRFESSKDSIIVTMNSVNLVDALLDPVSVESYLWVLSPWCITFAK